MAGTLSVNELYNSRPTSTDGITTTSSRLFVVQESDVNKELTSDQALKAPGIPEVKSAYGKGETYPTDTTLFADSKSVMRLGPKSYQVTVLYSNNNKWGAASNTDSLNPQYHEFSFQTGFEVVMFPLHKKNKIEFIADANGGEHERISWEAEEVKVKLTVTTLTVICNFLETDSNRLTYDKIHEIELQAGYVHRFIDGTYWRFLGGSSQLLNVGVGGSAYNSNSRLYRLEYQWSRRQDYPGLKLPNVPDVLDKIKVYRGPLKGTETVLVKPPTNFDDPPVYVVIDLHEVDAQKEQGWRWLPGNPLLGRM